MKKVYTHPFFEMFWDLYDKKVERKKCEKLWNKFDNNLRYEIIEHVNKYVKTTPNKRYRKNPYNYLYNECYYDEIIHEDYRHKEAFQHIINHYSQ